MISDLKPYPEYEDSGVPWLGKVPAHWDVRKLRSILRPVSVRKQPDLPLLSVVREKGVIRRNISSKEENYNFIPDDLSNYKVVRLGKVLVMLSGETVNVKERDIADYLVSWEAKNLIPKRKKLA
jgi:hypothetical protein